MMTTDKRSEQVAERAPVKDAETPSTKGDPRRPMPLGRSLVYLGISIAVSLVLIAIGYAVHPHPLLMHAEWGPIELTQKLGWFIVFLIGLLMWKHRGPWRDRLNGFWLALISYAALFRETDAHEFLNSESLGIWAISYKLTWIMDPQVPWYVKAAWAMLAVLGLVLVFGPLVVIRAPMVQMLMRRDAPSILFLLGVGFLGVGYICDDLIGRELILSVQTMQAIEETLELFGVIAVVWSTILTYRWPLTIRERWMGLERPGGLKMWLSS